jgi:RecA-family ATPase
VEYLIDPEIPSGAVVYLAGPPESGKSTLACAWGRDLAARGHSVLLLDKDRNPRAVIRERLERLGMQPADKDFWVWDSRQKSQPPQPDSPVVIEWVRGRYLETKKRPFVILDSAVSFLRPGEDENSSKDIRAFFNRCRAVVDAGGTVLVLHHPGKSGDLRGSSDFGAAADQGFVVTNSPAGKHLLSRLTLKVHKTRYALSTDLVYIYHNGKMLREPTSGKVVGRDGLGTTDELPIKLAKLLRSNPGMGSREFESTAKANRIPINKVRQFLKAGAKAGWIREQLIGRKKEHYLCGGAPDELPNGPDAPV